MADCAKIIAGLTADSSLDKHSVLVYSWWIGLRLCDYNSRPDR